MARPIRGTEHFVAETSVGTSMTCYHKCDPGTRNSSTICCYNSSISWMPHGGTPLPKQRQFGARRTTAQCSGHPHANTAY
eukprot:430522-Rhodomonas_salina.2